MDAVIKQQMINEYEEQLRGQGSNYSALELLRCRKEEAVADLAQGWDPCLKVPSGCETWMPADLARELLKDLEAEERAAARRTYRRGRW